MLHSIPLFHAFDVALVSNVYYDLYEGVVFRVREKKIW